MKPNRKPASPSSAVIEFTVRPALGRKLRAKAKAAGVSVETIVRRIIVARCRKLGNMAAAKEVGYAR